MARTPDGMMGAQMGAPMAPPAMTPEQFVFWARGYLRGTGHTTIEDDPNTVLHALLDGLDVVYLPAARGGCGCGGKG